ncbi:Homeobox protein Hox-A4, partial [Ophiophagus hannah]
DCEREGDASDHVGGQLPGGPFSPAPPFPPPAHPKACPVRTLPLHRLDLHRWEPAVREGGPFAQGADGLPSDALHPPSAPKEDPLFHRPAGRPAPDPLQLWDVPSALHEDDFPAHYDWNDPDQIQPAPQHHRSEIFRCHGCRTLTARGSSSRRRFVARFGLPERIREPPTRTTDRLVWTLVRFCNLGAETCNLPFGVRREEGKQHKRHKRGDLSPLLYTDRSIMLQIPFSLGREFYANFGGFVVQPFVVLERPSSSGRDVPRCLVPVPLNKEVAGDTKVSSVGFLASCSIGVVFAHGEDFGSSFRHTA